MEVEIAPVEGPMVSDSDGIRIFKSFVSKKSGQGVNSSEEKGTSSVVKQMKGMKFDLNIG